MVHFFYSQIKIPKIYINDLQSHRNHKWFACSKFLIYCHRQTNNAYIESKLVLSSTFSDDIYFYFYSFVRRKYQLRLDVSRRYLQLQLGCCSLS